MDQATLLELMAEIVASYVSGNPVPVDALPELIQTVHARLKDLEAGATSRPDLRLEPAVPISKSVTPDYIVCLEDGKKLKMMKRYLRTHFDLSPDEYRSKWGLPPDYPMVAPNYAIIRSEHAKEIGLGRKKK
jgi:predicted transcriptional regulator